MPGGGHGTIGGRLRSSHGGIEWVAKVNGVSKITGSAAELSVTAASGHEIHIDLGSLFAGDVVTFEVRTLKGNSKVATSMLAVHCTSSIGSDGASMPPPITLQCFTPQPTKSLESECGGWSL